MARRFEISFFVWSSGASWNDSGLEIAGAGPVRTKLMRAGSNQLLFVEVGVDAGGADDCFGGFEWNVLMVFEHAFEDAAEFAAAPGEEAGAMGVAVDRGAIGEFVFSGD